MGFDMSAKIFMGCQWDLHEGSGILVIKNNS